MLREFQDHSLQLLLCTILHLSMRSMEELLSSHVEAIGDLKEMRHLSRLVALHALGALSDICLSCCKVMFDALSFEEHEVGHTAF